MRGEPLTEEELKQYEEGERFVQALIIRMSYTWPWGAGARYLYREIIQLLGLEHREEELMQLAESKPGRKEERELRMRILRLHREGKTDLEIQQVLVSEGKSRSIDAIRYHRKSNQEKKPT